MELTINIRTAADTAQSYFTRGQRVNGTDVTDFWKLRDDAPEWVRDIVREAHGDMLPNDWSYAMIRDALIFIAEAEYSYLEDNDAAELVSIGTHELLDWVSSHGYRQAYADDALTELQGVHVTLADVLAWAQRQEYSEILNTVAEALADVADEVAA